MYYVYWFGICVNALDTLYWQLAHIGCVNMFVQTIKFILFSHTFTVFFYLFAVQTDNDLMYLPADILYYMCTMYMIMVHIPQTHTTYIDFFLINAKILINI